MAKAKQLDYDKLISQHILIKKKDSQDSSSVLIFIIPGEEIPLEEESDEDEEMYLEEQDQNELFTTTLNEEELVEEKPNDSDYRMEPVHRDRSPNNSTECESSDDNNFDPDWKKYKEVPKYFKCDQCKKKFISNRGMIIHQGLQHKNSLLQPPAKDN